MASLGLITGTPFSLILFQKASQEAAGSAIRNRYMNRALGIQFIIMATSYYTHKKTMGCLDRYSQKYLSSLNDEAILNFEKEDPKRINKLGNNL